MATNEPQVNILKVRSGHIGYLTKLYAEVENLMNDLSITSEVEDLKNRIESQFQKYIKVHYECINKSSCDSTHDLMKNHDKQVQKFQSMQKCIANYLNDMGLSSYSYRYESPKKSPSIRSSGSKSSNTSTQSQRLVESKLKLKLSQLKSKQLQESQELQRQVEQMTVKHEIEKNKLEVELWEQALSEGIDDNVSEHSNKVSTPKNTKPPTLNVDSGILKWNPHASNFIPASSIQATGNVDPHASNFIPPSSFQAMGNVNPHTSNYIPASSAQAIGNVNQAYSSGVYKNTPIHDTYQYQPTGYIPQSQQSQQDALTKVLMDINLPKRELMTFDGNAKNYQSFMTNFMTHIGSKVLDPSTQLTYLIQYCSGEAKTLIKNCVLMPPNEGFNMALALLKKHYGQNHQIARSYINSLTQGPQLKANDVDSLVQLSRSVSDCQIVLSQLQFSSEMNSSETIRAIAKRLPNHLHAKWVDRASEILTHNREPCFNDMSRFLEDKARTASTMYGREYAEMLRNRAPVKPKVPMKNNRFSTLATQLQMTDGAEPRQTQGELQPQCASTNVKNLDVEPKDNKMQDTIKSKIKQNCILCNMNNHSIQKCFQFHKLPVDKRLDAVKSAKLCFRCLEYGHMSKECKVVCSKCQRRHNVLLHDDERISPSKESDRPSNVPTASDTDGSMAINSTSTNLNNKVCLGILPVTLKGNGNSIKTYALLDSGSNATLLRRDLFNKLQIEGISKSFGVQTVNGNSPLNKQVETSVTITDLEEGENITLSALTVDHLPVSMDCLARKDDIKNWEHLDGIKIPEITENNIGILIGTNSPEMFWSLEERRGKRGEPIGRRTLLGWTVIGPVQQSPSSDVEVNLIHVDPLQQQLDKQWEVDFQDLLSDINQEMSRDDKVALNIMKSSIHKSNGKYNIAIPWKVDPESLPNNYRVAEFRLKALKRKFESNPKLKEQYTDTINKYLNDGHACTVDTTKDTENTPQWYLPHQPVFKKSNPEKCRVVFDCSSKYQDTSLNDAIYQGPNLLNNLSGVLIRFRKDYVAIVADIEAMFHQCRVTEKDKNFLRFLWWPNGDTTKPPDIYAMAVHLFGATSSPSVANYCLHKTCEDNHAEFSSTAINTVFKSFYMDDLLKSVSTVEEAISLIGELKSLLSKGGFNLTKWISTHRDVINSIPEEERAKSLKNVNVTEMSLPQEPTLGLQWNVESDTFIFDVQTKEKPMTRRGLLSMTASLFDPLGFMCPVTLIPKLIQQNLCREKLGWDDPIPQHESQEFMKWQQSLSLLSQVKIKRCFVSELSSEPQQVELHIFCDASEFAYGATAYLKLYNGDEKTVQLVMAKSRVAPLKAITIPRLELTAATVAAKLHKFLQNEMNIHMDKVYFWTDSITVLRYLQNTSTRFKRFVSNRIQVIQELTNIDDWNYVPSSLNPADLASRGIQPKEQEKLKCWLKGPEFLYTSDNYDAVSSFKNKDSTTEELEIKNSFACEVTDDFGKFLESFSSFNKLLIAVSWFKKFIKYLKLKSAGQDIGTICKNLQVCDLEDAESQVLCCIQGIVFHEEIKRLQQNLQVAKSSSLSSLCPIYENNLVKVGGRLDDSETDLNKHPVILPNHYVTDLIIEQVHEKTGHSGVNYCLSVVRRKYFVLKGYQTVQRVVKSCFNCKKQYKKPSTQKMANLPKERTSVGDPPFTVVGIDYFGPMFVKFGRGTVKRYGLLITCLASRALHLEVSHSLDSDSFLLAFHRFIARRGKPTKVFSDNGTNLVAADKELKEAVQQLNSKKVKDSLLLEAIEWNFIPPHAPHMGGVWERLVRSVKNVLKSLMKQQLLNDEQLSTFMCEAEKILNDRPLTTVSSDNRDCLPITPNHLLLMRRNDCSPTTETNYVKRRWQVIQKIANKFYSRFVAEYLPLLQQRQKWTSIQDNLRVNDIVLVVDENSPRGQWPLGLITKVTSGRDNLVRSAQVKIGKSVKTRPITKLVLLEHHD